MVFGMFILSVLLVGCGKSSDEGTGKNQASEKVKLTFMAVGGSNQQAYTNLMESVAEQFNNDNAYHAEIEMEWYENQQYKTKLATLMTQNSVPDIFFTMEAGFMKDYVESGKVFSLSEAFANDSEWFERFNDGIFKATTFDDKIYAMPMGQEIVITYYNKKIFADNNLAVPKTWDAFMGNIKTLKDKGIIPISMATQDAWVSGNLMLELSGGIGGVELFDAIVDGTTTWDDERYVESGKAFQEMVNAGAFPEGFLGLSYDEGRTLFTTEKAAMYAMGTWETKAIIGAMGSDENVGVFLQPPKKQEYADTHVGTLAKLYAISERCEHKEAALAFLKMLSDPDVQEKYVVDCGGIASTKVTIDENKLDKVTQQVRQLQQEVKNPLIAIDRQFGANIGGEFNNISVYIASGADPKEQFTALQKYAEQETKQ